MAEQEDTPLTASPAPRPGQVGPVHQRKSCGTSILKWAAIIVSIGAVGYFVLGAVTSVATHGSIGGGVGVGNGSSASAHHRRSPPEDGSNCDPEGLVCSWLFEIGEEANVDPDERLNRYDSEPLVVARLKEELATFAAAEVTCEEADTWWY